MSTAKESGDSTDITPATKVLALEQPNITVLSDSPLSAPNVEQDSFNFGEKLAPIYDIIRHKSSRTPMAIAIYGDWGVGKTSAMKWLEGLVREWNKNGDHSKGKAVRPVWFYPWKFHTKDDVWRGLVSEVIIASINAKEATTSRVTTAVKQFGIFLGRSFLHALSSIKLKADDPGGVGGAEINFSALRDIYEEYEKVAHPERPYLNEFESTLRTWIKETISSSNERLVIFVDDLDRCLPEVALQVLEALKLYLNIKDVIIVIGVDRGVIDQLVQQHYAQLGLDPEKSKNYLGKMFQVEVTIAPTETQVEKFLYDQISAVEGQAKEYWDKELRDFEKNIFCEVALNLAERNPREIKRLINSMVIHGCGALSLNGASNE